LSDLTKYSASTGLPALPNANYPVGAVVYNTNDGKIWRNVNGAWSSATAASDVSGALTACTIEAIHLTTLNGLITGAQIGQINASSISVVNAGAVYGGLTNASISALNITTLNGGIQANQIASINFNNTSLTGQIQATNIGSINASTINVISNQITGIQAGNITAGTITGWTINGTTINSTNINSSVISLTYNFENGITETITISPYQDGITQSTTSGYQSHWSAAGFSMSYGIQSSNFQYYLIYVQPSYNVTSSMGSQLTISNVTCINSSGTFVGAGVSCSSYGVNCYSATVGYGGISSNGNISSNGTMTATDFIYQNQNIIVSVTATRYGGGDTQTNAWWLKFTAGGGVWYIPIYR
jgi:hypothetical protein